MEKEGMNRRFDEKFVESFCNKHQIRPCKECGDVKSFIQSEIDLAVSNREKEIMSMIEHKPLCSYPKSKDQAQHDYNTKIIDDAVAEAKETLLFLITKS